MLVRLIGRNVVYKLELPKVVFGSYSISTKIGNKEKKLINIEAKNGRWQIRNNQYTQISNLNTIKNSAVGTVNDSLNKSLTGTIVLQEYEMYGVAFKNTKEMFVLYCSPTYENNFTNLNIEKNQEIWIGNGNLNQISYTNKLVQSMHAKLSYYDGRWSIENTDSRFGTFVNDKPVPDGGTILVNGDVIFIMGLRIIIMGRSIFINNPNKMVSCSSQVFNINRRNVNVLPRDESDQLNETVDLYNEREYFSRSPRIVNLIEEEKIKIDSPPQMQNKEEMPMLLAVGSSLTMGLVMVVSIMGTLTN